MLFFLQNLFKRSPIKKLLGGGLILNDDQNKFYIDSDTSTEVKGKNLTIFRNEIRKIINNNYKDRGETACLTDTEKIEIAFKAKNILVIEGFTVTISPEFPLEFLVKINRSKNDLEIPGIQKCM